MPCYWRRWPLCPNSPTPKPSRFPISNLNDSGAGSFRAAIESANVGPSADTINFSLSVFNTPGTISLQSALPNLSNVSINGPGATILTLRRGVAAPFRIFTIPAGVTATISGLKLENGKAPGFGGAVNNSGTLTMSIANFRIDADGDSNTSEPAPFDQRGAGFPRIAGAKVDIGAFERASSAPTTYAVSGRTVIFVPSADFTTSIKKGRRDITIILKNAAGLVIKTRKTDEFGGFRFGAVAAGNYKVSAILERAGQPTVRLNPNSRDVTVVTADVAVPRFELYTCLA